MLALTYRERDSLALADLFDACKWRRLVWAELFDLICNVCLRSSYVYRKIAFNYSTENAVELIVMPQRPIDQRTSYLTTSSFLFMATSNVATIFLALLSASSEQANLIAFTAGLVGGEHMSLTDTLHSFPSTVT